MKITRQEKVEDQGLVEKLWGLYDSAFTPLRVESPCRQFFNQEEFEEEMVDSRVLKFVLWDEGDPVALAFVATDLSAVPWAEPLYFQARYPKEYAEGRIYYFGTLCTTPEGQRSGYATTLLAELENFMIRVGGIAAYDCMELNAAFLPEVIAATTREQGNLRVDELPRQHYYAFVTQGFLEGHGPSEYARG